MTEWPPTLLVRDWSAADSAAVSHWGYADRWSVYDQPGDDPATDAGGRSHRCRQDGGEVSYTMLIRHGADCAEPVSPAN